MPLNILIADDELPHAEAICERIGSILKASPGRAGFTFDDLSVEFASTADDITERIEQIRDCDPMDYPYDLIVADVFMPSPNAKMPTIRGGWQRFFDAICKRLKATPAFMDERLLIAVTTRGPECHPVLSQIVNCNKANGSSHAWCQFLHKPNRPEIAAGHDPATLIASDIFSRAVLTSISRFRDVQWRSTFLGKTSAELCSLSPIFVDALQRAIDFAHSIPDPKEQKTPPVIAVFGETGTGKDLIARAIHENSNRRGLPFLAHVLHDPSRIISELCGHEKGAFTGADRTRMGVFERAEGGVVFLDEVGTDLEAFQSLDKNLRRLIQFGEFERMGGTQKLSFRGVLILAGSQLKRLLNEATTSDDVRHRIGSNVIELPPLRDRPDDLPCLAESMLARLALQGNPIKVLDASSLRWMRRHPWPGNVRELEKLMEAISRNCVDLLEISEDDLRQNSAPSISTSEVRHQRQLKGQELLEKIGRGEVQRIYEKNNKTRSQTAKELDVDPKTLKTFLNKDVN